jgi:GAF domain-containing protein
VTARPAGPVLRAASQLCTDLGRVSDLEELKQLVGQAADLMDASGIVIWISAPDGTYVHPALSHGYPPHVMARMSRIPRSADNAAAAAYRTGQIQIVLAHPGESNGAVVAPLLSTDGCIGALSAEIRGGGESSESVQALAAIFAAQLAGVLHTASAAQDQRTTATGTL